jgi:hypothetical protein
MGYESYLDNGNLILVPLNEQRNIGRPYNQSPDTFTYLEAM